MLVELATTSKQREDAFNIRHRVFVDEQGVDETVEWDEYDDPKAPTAHFVVYTESQPVGTARLRALNETDTSDVDSNSTVAVADADADIGIHATEESGCALEETITETTTIGKVERVAVLADYRNQGWGTRLMQAVETHAHQCGLSMLRLHAQTRVESFYHDQGYETISDVFEEAGIPHVSMEKRL